MTNIEILHKAIEKATENGYKLPIDDDYWDICEYKDKGIYLDLGAGEGTLDAERIIFDHSFAKAFWNCSHEFGEYALGSYKETCIKCGFSFPIGCYNFGGWEYHLQQMVLKENPILYLARFL